MTETAKRFADYCKAENKSQSCVFAELVDLLANADVMARGRERHSEAPTTL